MLHLFQIGVMIFAGFLSGKSIKSEQNLKNVGKSPKHSFTNSFVGSLTIYSKGKKQIWRMANPFKGPVTFFGLFFSPEIP